ncbi:hypothetical protein OW763_13905 [Clostridium aestuarii]|uniref:Uncharacterized protein n=1 Tax=Clostridium aestuarii TaxID=338193 RepID=A0ABT4D5F1_9CLOT|nr:hypothetical protein [Clostridium aestuarii]MCY6485425.1 hypothetical protein [Clostridium aestuarii]
MYNFIWILLLIAFVVYESWWRPKVCKEKINEEIKKIGGEVLSIEKLTSKKEIYHVIYKVGEKQEKVVIEFNFIYEQFWR